MIKILMLCILCYLVHNVWCDCFLKIPINKGSVPLWEKKIGDRWFKIPHINNQLKLQDGEIIKGHCPTKFNNIHYQANVTITCDYYDYECRHKPWRIETRSMEIQDNITVECFGDLLEYESLVLTQTQLECEDPKWIVNVKSIQNSETETSWCKDDHQIFELSTNNMDPNRALGFVCYDLTEFSLQSIKYKTITRKAEAWNANKFLPSVLSDLPEAGTSSSEVEFLNATLLHTENDNLQNYIERLSEKNPWLKLARYEYANIIQSGPFMSHFHQYHQLLDILWWNNLRITNWHRFLNALEQHTNLHSYTIYMGTLHVVQVPIWSNPGEFQYLEIQNGFVNNTIPQYVWTYLESSDGKNPDLYVFGYNSPYAEFFYSNKVKFCTDICSDFDWLTDVRSSFHYANFGIVFCCSPESVQKSAYGTKLPYKLPSPVLEKDLNEKEKKEETIEITEKPELLEKSEESEEFQTLENYIYTDRNPALPLKEGSGD